AELIGPVSSNQHQARYISPSDQIADQLDRRHVQPLQVVNEKDEGATGAGKGPNQPPENDAEAIQPILGREIRNRMLTTEEKLERGNKLRHNMAVRSDRVRQRLAPNRNVLVVVSENLSQQRREGLVERRVGDVARLQIEFAHRAQSIFRRQARLELRDKR